MRTGGTAFCAAWCAQRSCKYPIGRGRNCRLVQFGHVDWRRHFKKLSGGYLWHDLSLTREIVNATMSKLPMLCGIIMNEPAYEGAFTGMERFEQPRSPFWRAYTSVLLVRDPLHRYISFVELTSSDMIANQSWHSCVDGSKRPITQRRSASTRYCDVGMPVGWFRQRPVLINSGSNYLTAHLVKNSIGFAGDPLYKYSQTYPLPFMHFTGVGTAGRTTTCNQSVLNRGKKAVGAFDLVLNLADLPRASARIAQRILGLDISGANSSSPRLPPHLERSDGSNGLQYSWRKRRILASDLVRFREMNRCDYELMEFANARVHALEAGLTGWSA